jgi:putative ABC transport system permease protein
MRVADTTRLALRNLREAVLRTSLTSLGVAIGIAALVGMVSFGVALQDQMVESFTRSGLFDSITVTPAFRVARNRPATPANQFRRSTGPSPQAPPDAKLDDEALKKFAALANVKEVYPDFRVPVEVMFGGTSEFTAAAGVPLSARGRGVFQAMTAGRFFKAENEDACLVSLDFARRLTDGKPESLVGKDVKLAYAASAAGMAAQMMPALSGMLPPGVNVQRTERSFRVVGIVGRQAGPNPLAALFSAVMVPLAKAREMGNYDLSSPQALLRSLSDKRSYSMVTVKVARPRDTEEVEKKIRDMGFTAFSIADALQSEKKAFLLMDLFLALVGSIALTVASLGIVNTMVMSILERTRDIGIMKAIGGGDEDIRWIFLVEASLIGLLGGVGGLLLGWLVGRGINYGANWYLRTQDVPATNLFLIPWWLVGGGIGFALVVSVIAGSFPAMRAARLDPIQALRHD